MLVVLPGLVLSLFLLMRSRDQLRENRAIVLIALVLSIVQAHPLLQSAMVALAGDPGHPVGHAMPVFIALYLLFGRFRRPSPAFAYALTFLTLLAADIAIESVWLMTGVTSAHRAYTGIGAGGWLEGLFWLPLLSGLLTLVIVRLLTRGVRFRWMRGCSAMD